MTQSYPLKWPVGWKRTPADKRRAGPFQVTFDRARSDLYSQLQLLGARDVVISSWLELRMDGQPRADSARRRIDDPGVALYFTLRGRQMTMARDVYWSVMDNLRSIGLAVAHLRGLERHGGAAMMERAFEGFAALPPPGEPQRRPWRGVLMMPAMNDDKSMQLTVAEAIYRRLVKDAARDQLIELNLAIEDARKELR